MDNIYEDYGYEDVLLNSPCEYKNISIYPIKVKDWNKFGNYIYYFILSKKHYGIKEEDSLLEAVFVNNVLQRNGGKPPETKEADELLSNFVLSEMCKVFELITNIKGISFIYNKGYKFVSEDKVIIDDNNFDDIRKIVLSQNILFEPIIYESKFQQKWAEKVKRGRTKNNKGIGFEEIINIVRCGLGISYQEIANMNIFQLYSDFRRITNTKEFETITLLKTTYGMEWDKLPSTNYTDSVIDKLITNPEKDYFKDFDMGDMQEILNG